MAKHTGDFSGFVELGRFPVEVGGLFVSEHWSLAAGDQNGVEVENIDRGNLFGVLNQAHEFGRVNEAHADQIARRVSARISRVAHGIGFG